MSDDKGKSGGGLAILLMAVVALLLPIVYVLSIGPAVWLLNRGLLPETPLVTIYAPLEWLARSSDWFQAAAEWYIQFWE